jgi:hypothetical protein
MIGRVIRRHMIGALVLAAGLALTATPAARPAYASAGTPAAATRLTPQASPPCSGVGTTTGGIRWNGCVFAVAGLKVRSHNGTGPVTTGDPVIATYSVNTLLHVECTLSGFGVNGSTLWDAVDAFQPPGGRVTFFVPSVNPFPVSTDFWIYTGTNNPIARHC